MRVSHMVLKKEVYSGGMGRLWRIAILRGGGIFWEGTVDYVRGGIVSGSVTYRCRKGGIFRKEGIDSGSATLYKTGVYFGREGWIMRVSLIFVKKRVFILGERGR